jgi:nicotinamidase/pyrazinamidase
MQALILVDIQNDFCPGGALAAPRGDEGVPIANALMRRVPLVLATQDFHPQDHGSFAANHPGQTAFSTIDLHGLPQVLWPVHCVQGTPGVNFHPGLQANRITRIFPKGTDKTVDSYSGFFDNGRRKGTGLDEYLRAQAVTEVYVLGLATDYCVRATVRDAVQLGYATTLIVDGCRAVNLQPDDGDKAVADMAGAGAKLARSTEVR